MAHVSSRTRSRSAYRSRIPVRSMVAVGRYIGQRFRHRGGRTATQTSERNNSVDSTVGGHSGFATLTKSISLKHPYNKRCMGSAKLQLTDVTQTCIGNTAGIQYNGLVASCLTTKQIMVSTATAATFEVLWDEGSTRLWDLNPYRATTGSALLVPTTTPRNDQLFVSNVVMQTDVRNFSSAGVIVDLYYMTPNQNTNQNPLVVWEECLQASSDGTLAVLSYPGAGSTSTKAGIPNTIVAGIRPSQVAGFSKTWKILHTHHMVLGSGSSESITMNVNTNYLIDYRKIVQANNMVEPSTFTNANITNNFLRHGTVVIFATMRGEVVKDVTVGEKATFAQTDVGFVTSKRYCVKMLSGNASRVDTQVAASSIPTGTSLANQKQVNAQDASAPVVES